MVKYPETVGIRTKGDIMAIRALKCPSCGADITLDDSREFGFCSYCGTQIQIGERINVHVTHEHKGDAPHVHVTNNYYYEDLEEAPKVHITVERPAGKKLGWGIVLGVLGVIGLSNSAGKGASYIVLSLVFLVIAVLLLVSYFRAMKIYGEAVRKTANQNVIFQEKKTKRP